MMFEVRGWRVEKGGKVFHNLERLNLNKPTLSRRDATEGERTQAQCVDKSTAQHQRVGDTQPQNSQ